MGAMSPWHWAIVLLVLVLLFGSKRLPDAARGLGRSMRIFKSEVKEMQQEGDAAPKAPPGPTELPPLEQAPQQVVQPTESDHKSA